ncbi:MAG TPA: cation:proton antiporter [Clostridia bacterium]|nr:cation:proton antiporter [Clostridia bacterium]
MSNADFGTLTLQLFLLIAAAHLLGHVFTRLRQPRVIGEILAGVLLGPSTLGHFAPAVAAAVFPGGTGNAIAPAHEVVLGFLYNMGLMLLMFTSGAETKGLFQRSDRREIAWLGSVGTGLPFVLALAAAPFLPLYLLAGTARNRVSLLLVVGIAVAVTSIPVISRILHDLKILHTRFARLVLGVAVLEDIALWAVLAIATALAASSTIPQAEIVQHVVATLVYFALGLTVAPRLLKRLNRARWNILAKASPVGYVVVVLLAYAAVAAALDVSLVFAAFLAGFGMAADAERMADSLDSLKTFSFAVFIPLYFAVVGYRLDLSRSFSLSMLAVFLLLACAVKLFSAGLGAKLAGFGWRDTVNLAVATNARGGPGIVLASVAYDAGVINAAFYTTLVLVAVITSQAAGFWLEYVLRKGWPLLSSQQAEVAIEPGESAASDKIAA